jgi:hypothetical protein
MWDEQKGASLDDSAILEEMKNQVELPAIILSLLAACALALAAKSTGHFPAHDSRAICSFLLADGAVQSHAL